MTEVRSTLKAIPGCVFFILPPGVMLIHSFEAVVVCDVTMNSMYDLDQLSKWPVVHSFYFSVLIHALINLNCRRMGQVSIRGLPGTRS